MAIHDLSVLDEVHVCPHCKRNMECCEAPQMHVGDGLGWGSDVLFICLNDECSLFIRGWEYVEMQYGHKSSYRYMELPGSSESNVMMVGSKNAFKGSVLQKAMLQAQNKRFQKEKKAVEALESCVEDGNLEPALTLLLDEAASPAARKKAASLLVALNDLSCIDPLRNHEFKESSLEQDVNMQLTTLLQKNFKKECPYCSEIIKAQASKCMHCKEEV